MKLIKCKTCDGEIAKSAETCPHCGAKNVSGLKAAGQGLVGLGCLLILIPIVFILAMFAYAVISSLAGA